MRRRELFPSLCQLAVARLELPQRLDLVPQRPREALLQVADLRPIILGPAANRGLGFLGLGGLWTPAHRPPLVTYESAGDRLRRTRPPGQVGSALGGQGGRGGIDSALSLSVLGEVSLGYGR